MTSSVATNSKVPLSAIKYCQQLVRERAYHDTYLPVVCYPAKLRSYIWPLHALDLELRAIPNSTQQPHLRQIRWLWWKQAVIAVDDNETGTGNINDISSNAVDGSLVAKAVRYSVQQLKHQENSLYRFQLSNLFKGHEQMLTLQQYTSMEHLEQLSDQTLGSVFRLQLELAGRSDQHGDHLASHLAKSLGICRLLQSVRRDCRGVVGGRDTGSKVMLPQQLMAEHAISNEEIRQMFLSSSSSDHDIDRRRLRDLVYQMASDAHLHLDTAERHLSEVPKRQSSAVELLMLHSLPARRYLELLQRNRFDLIDIPSVVFDWRLYYRLWQKLLLLPW